MAWRRCRLGFLQSENFVCNRCKGIATLAHHKEELTAANVTDFNIALSWDNLESLCDPCHERQHRKQIISKGLAFDDNGNIVSYD